MQKGFCSSLFLIFFLSAFIFCTHGESPAGVITFSDLDPGLPLGQEGPIPMNYDTGVPSGITATWVDWSWKNTVSKDDHTVVPDDRMSAYQNLSGASILFSAPVIVDELWGWNNNWGDPGAWTIAGTLKGIEQWGRSISTERVWVNVDEGSGIEIDTLVFGNGLWSHIDDISLSPVSTVPVPGAVWLLGSGLICIVGLKKRTKK